MLTAPENAPLIFAELSVHCLAVTPATVTVFGSLSALLPTAAAGRVFLLFFFKEKSSKKYTVAASW